MSPVDLMTGANGSAPDLCISQLIENQAGRTPDAIAIAAPGRTPLTYNRLHRQIDETVKKLNAMGVRRHDRVALALPNGPEMAVAFLAVAAGATCAPLNPVYQFKEFDFFLTDLNPKALILWSGVGSPARVVARKRAIPIIELSPVLEAEAGVFALAGDVRSHPVDTEFTQPDDVALVLHTSGTTARPKIIPLTHINICSSAHYIRTALELVRSDRCLNVMPLFHVHGLVGAVLSSVAAGASVICASGIYAPKFFPWMEEFRPTWYTAVPTMHQAILARAASNREVIAHCPLRFIRSSSSHLPPQVMTELENVFNTPVIEAYGMTEASHQITSNPLPPRPRKAGSVGLAMGSELAVVDDAGQFLRAEEVGEIVIRGANVTQGYENGSTLNERAFTEGWLRTGDQGYLDSDGYLFITGRLKEVINRGGEKISPHEVDEALMNHPAIAQAVTFPVPHGKLGEDIAAAVVLRENAAATEREIQEFAAARLADFKVPRQVIIVDAIPQGPTGKLQRAGLAEKLVLRASAGHDVRAAYTAPRTPIEEKLSEIWSEILAVQRVGVDDNFFQLGGDSLLATQVISRVREALHAELSFVGFFETPTVASLAAAVAHSQAKNAEDQKISHRSTELETVTGRCSDQSIPRRVNRDRAPLSFAQERIWFLDQLEPGNPAYNRPVNFRIPGRLDVKALELSLSEIIGRHEALRTRFAVESGNPVQVICPARSLSLSLVDLYEYPAAERERWAQALAAEEAQLPFDLGQGPLMRSTLLRLSEEDHLLLLTIHHIAFDGWSLSVLACELAGLYKAYCAGQPQPLPELPIQYADYSHWQRQWLQGDVLQTQLSYWKQQLDCVPVLDLPTDRPRPPVQTFRGAKQSLVLSSRLTEELKRLSLREGVTPFMSLLAAFTTLLHGYTGQDDIAVGTFIINRNRAETEGLIGFFINNLVLRTDLSGDPSFRDLLMRVRTVALTAYAHQDLPFEKLLEQLRPERDRSRTPLFQVMLVLQNAPGSALVLAGLTSSSYPVAQSTRSNFDLTLWMSDGIEGLTGVLEYNADLFEAVTMTRMLENFQFLLEGIVADPDQHLSTLSISLVRERRRRSARGNDTEAISPVDAQVTQVDGYANPVDDTAERQAQLSQRRARLSAAKRALLEKRLRGEWAGSTKIIHRRPDNGPAPLSFAQQRLWFLDQLMPGSAYNSPGAFRIESAIDVALAERIVNEIVRRHEVLRTTFQSIEGQPFQVVAPVLTVPVAVVDLGNLPEPKREAAVRRLATEEAQRPFDLSQGPLLRVTLLRLGDHEHVFLVTMHHIISDGWSIGVFIREAVALYGAFSTGAPSPLPELPIQYTDFAVWQREWLQGEVLEGQLGYWRQQLADISVLQLPTDHPRPAVQTSPGKRQGVALPQALSDALKALSRQERTTLFMTLLAAFKILLHRYTGQDDLVVGTPIANRNRLEIDGLIGFFVNTLVLRTDLAGNPSFRELLRRVREVCLGAYARQDLPFERLVEELHLERDLSRNPLFQVMFVLENISLRAAELPGLTLSPIEADSETALFDLTLQIIDAKQGLTAAFVYNTDLFEAATVARMLGNFQTLLEAVVGDPDKRLSNLALLTNTERQQLLVQWNDTKTDYPKEVSVHELFEAQVERTPDAVAVVFEGQQLTYQELNRRSNQLAHHLRALGVGPEVAVGVCLERSLEMVIGLLAILKAGGVYVPLDPAYPKERLAFMLKDAQVPVLLTLERLVAGLPECEARVICLDSGWGTIASESGENPINLTTPENLAYIIYTSGSTGQPKGVLVSQGSIADYCRTTQRYYELDASDGVLQFASLSFDVSLEEILPTLIVGAKLVVMGTTMWSPAEFHRKISEFGLTVITLPTPYWQELARQWASVPELVPNIQPRLFMVGGDTMLPEALNLWRRTPVNSVRLLNAYGPTEATIAATAWEFSPRLCENRTFQRIPIGRPIANREIYILDNYDNPVPVGVCGELCIGGAGIARGYLNRPELTAEKFIPNPFSDEPGTRLYKTGDLACYLPDGNIEFLGRVDHQVKIRGFRIELGEIESALGQYPAVRETVVLARQDAPGERRLVAYVVADQESHPTANDLRSFLKKKLPEHMVPALFVLLDGLPLMPNGKVDRRALPAPDRPRPEPEKVFVAPRDDLELQLAQIWEEVLGVRPVGVRDNFFELGGHSLLAARLFASIENRLGKKLPLATVFQGATVEHLAGILRQDAKPAPRSSLVAIQPGGSKRPLFLVHPAGGHVFPYVHLARYLGPDQPCYGLQARGLEEGEKPHTRIEDMASDYIKALRTVQPNGPYLLGGWSMGGLVAFEMAQQLHAQAEGVDLLALLDTRMTPPDEKDSEGDLDAMLLADFFRYFGLSLDLLESFARLPKDQVLTHVLELAQCAGLVPPNIEISQAHRFVELLKSDFQASRNYELHRYPGRVTLFKASEELEGTSPDPTLGWSQCTVEEVEVHLVPGNHANMVYQPHVEGLAEKLRDCLNHAQSADQRLTRSLSTDPLIKEAQ